MSNDFPFNHFINFNNNKNNNLEGKIEDYQFPKVEAKEEKSQSKSVEIEQSSIFSAGELASIAEEVLISLKDSISTEKYSAFFENNLSVSNISNETVYFNVTTNFIKKMINNHYLEQFKQILLMVLGKSYNIEVSVLGTTAKNKELTTQNSIKMSTQPILSEKTEESKPKVNSFKLNDHIATEDEIKSTVESTYMKYRETNYRIDKTKKFENFITGHSNNMACAFSLGAAKDPGVLYPQLYIHGNSGLGKTHLLYAICNMINETRPTLRIKYTNANEFMSEMVVAIQKNETNVFRRKYTELTDVLIIDDIHELKNKTRTQSEFFYIFNELQSKGKQLVFTSDKHPKEINGIEDRIRTRLSSALLIDIQQPDLETRIAILKKKSLEKDIYLDDEVINLIATCVKTNVRELEGNLVKLGAYSDLMNVDIDLEIAKEQLNLSENSEDKVITVDTISKAVASYYKITIGDIKGKSRKKEVALARHISMYMCHKILKKTLEEIGEYFNNRDHSTVIHGIKKIQNLTKQDSKISHQLYEIESKL